MFDSTNLKLSRSTIGPNDNVDVIVTVQNTGAVAGKEVVQVYVTDVISSTVTTNQHLVGFSKVDLA